MNNLRISILSLTIILFSLGALMLPVNTTLAHHCKGGHSGNPKCNAGDPDSGVVTYSMVFSGALPGDSNDDTYTTSGKGIGVLTNNGVLSTTIDLTFFADLFDAGVICFGGGDGYVIMTDHTFNPRAVGVKEGKRGRAEATVIFNALTDDGSTPAVYGLHTIGFFETNDWPPENEPAIVTMTSWEIGLNNHNPSDLTGACLSEGEFDPAWEIEVSLDP